MLYSFAMGKNEIKVRRIIEENLYLTISVCDKSGNPWIANLYYVVDNQYNFYWYSPKTALHSLTIRDNPNVAIAIFNSTAVGDDVDAVYIQAKAYEVTSKLELVAGLRIYAQKMIKTGFAESKQMAGRFMKQYQDFQGLSKLRMYKAVPERVWKMAPSEMYNDKFVDSRIEVDL